MNKPSDVLSELTVTLLENKYDFEREKKGELNRRKLDREFEEAKCKALDSITALANAPGIENEKAAYQEIENLLDTAREIYVKVGAEISTKLTEQKSQQEKETQKQTPPKASEPEEIPHREAPPDARSERMRVEFSKDFYERIAEGTTLQLLGAHVLRDGEPRQLIKKPYRERMDEAESKLQTALKSMVDKIFFEQVEDAVNGYSSVVGDVNFTLGMKVGARINAQLLGAIDKDYC